MKLIIFNSLFLILCIVALDEANASKSINGCTSYELGSSRDIAHHQLIDFPLQAFAISADEWKHIKEEKNAQQKPKRTHFSFPSPCLSQFSGLSPPSQFLNIRLF